MHQFIIKTLHNILEDNVQVLYEITLIQIKYIYKNYLNYFHFSTLCRNKLRSAIWIINSAYKGFKSYMYVKKSICLRNKVVLVDQRLQALFLFSVKASKIYLFGLIISK